jgi:hypothetical protein
MLNYVHMKPEKNYQCFLNLKSLSVYLSLCPFVRQPVSSVSLSVSMSCLPSVYLVYPSNLPVNP